MSTDSAQTASSGSDLLFQLHRNSVFNGCPANVLEYLAAHGSLNSGKRGTKVVEAGGRFDFIGLVCDGVVSSTILGEGPMRGVHRLQLYESGPGSVFGDVAFLSGTPPGDILVVSKHATYALFPSTVIELAIESDPALLRRLAKHTADLACDLAQQLAAQHGWSAMSRIAAVLLRFASNQSGLQPAEPGLEQLTQRDIAAAAGCVKEVAARSIAQLEEAGGLRRQRGHIRYLNRELLSTFALDVPLTRK
jgi:CRP-like cAMP-binding protein